MSKAGQPLPEEFIQALYAALSNDLALVGLLAPHKSQEELQAGLQPAVRECISLAEKVLPSFTDPQKAADHPYIQVIAKHRTDPAEAEIAFSAFKRLDNSGVDNTEEALKAAMVIAFLTSPVARMLLAIYGYQYRFLGVKELALKPVIHTH
jgi:hypothetical protein